VPDKERYEIVLDVTGLGKGTRDLQRFGQAMGMVDPTARTLGQGLGGALGSAELVGKLALFAGGVALAAKAVMAFAQIVSDSVETLGGVGRLQAQLGSSFATTGLLRSIGGALGVDMGSLSERIRAASNDGGLGTAAAMRSGIRPGQLDLGSAVDQGQMVMQAIHRIRELYQSGDKSGALAEARALKAPELYQSVYLTNEQIERMTAQVQRNGGIFSEEAVARAGRLRGEVQMLSNEWEAFTTMIGEVAIPFLTAGLEKVNAFLSHKTTNPFGPQGVLAAPSDFKAHAQAMQGHTQALSQQTAALRNMQGIYGGGNGARLSIPQAYGPGGGYYVSDALRAHAIRWGAFSMGL
jgi:hypothetical protein